MFLGVMEPTGPVGLHVVVIVDVVGVGQVREQVRLLRLLDVMHLRPVVEDALDPALARGHGGPGPGSVTDHPRVVTQLNFLPGRLVDDGLALKQFTN